jgi:low affinity Fe/Cu permease
MTHWFERFAAAVSRQVAKPWFFVICLSGVLFWVLLGFVMGWTNDLYHLLLNSPTTALTFLLLALFQNTDGRTSGAIHEKLDLTMEAIAQVLDQTDGVDESGELARDLRDRVGVKMESDCDELPTPS